MANKKISQLSPVTTLGDNDVFPVVQGTQTKKAKILDIKSYLPTASSVDTGLLSYSDWITFNTKQTALTFGDLTESSSSVLTINGGSQSVIGFGTSIQVKKATSSQDGYLSSADWSTFNGKMSGLTLTTSGTSGAATYNSGTATLNIPQYLGAAVTSINGSTTAAQTIQTGSTGTDFTIATVAGTTTVAIPTASASARGLLSSSDWSTFNGKQNALTLGNLTETTSSVLTITGGTGATVGNVTIAVKAASASQSGYLSSSNFTTFAGKQDALTLTTTGSSGAATLVGSVLNIPQYTGGSGTVTSVAALTLGTTGTDLSSSVANSTTTPVITLNVPTASATNRGALSAADWTTFNSKQGALTLTTTGSSGAATLVGTTLNIPQYSGGGSTIDFYTTGFGLMGSTLKGINLSVPFIKLPFSVNLGSGIAYFYAYYLESAYTITGCRWHVNANGSYTANNYNGVALYTYSGGTITQVASSTNDGTIWSQGTGWRNKAFSSTYSASAGLYFIGFLYSSSAQTTAPALGAFYAENNSNVRTYDFTNSAKNAGTLSAQTSLSSSIASSTISSTTNNIGIYLY